MYRDLARLGPFAHHQDYSLLGRTTGKRAGELVHRDDRLVAERERVAPIASPSAPWTQSSAMPLQWIDEATAHSLHPFSWAAGAALNLKSSRIGESSRLYHDTADPRDISAPHCLVEFKERGTYGSSPCSRCSPSSYGNAAPILPAPARGRRTRDSESCGK